MTSRPWDTKKVSKALNSLVGNTTQLTQGLGGQTLTMASSGTPQWTIPKTTSSSYYLSQAQLDDD